MEDANFLTETFKGADIVYGMETLDAAGGFFNKNLDYITAINKIGNNYKEAIHRSGVKRGVHFNSISAHMDKGNGLLVFITTQKTF